MFIAIYENGQNTQRETVENIFSLPGKYQVYSIEESKLYQYVNPETKAPLKVGKYEITYFKHNMLRSNFELYDHATGQLHNLQTSRGHLDTVIINLKNELEFASKFSNFNIYLEFEDIKSENKTLKTEIEKLKKELRQLKIE